MHHVIRTQDLSDNHCPTRHFVLWKRCTLLMCRDLKAFQSSSQRKLWPEGLRLWSCSLGRLDRWQLWVYDGIRCYSLVQGAKDNAHQRIHHSHRCVERWLHIDWGGILLFLPSWSGSTHSDIPLRYPTRRRVLLVPGWRCDCPWCGCQHAISASKVGMEQNIWQSASMLAVEPHDLGCRLNVCLEAACEVDQLV